MPKGRIIKSFVYLSEMGPTDGPLAVVPGSHRLYAKPSHAQPPSPNQALCVCSQFGPWETYRRSFRSSMTLDAELPQECMANHIKFTGSPGDVLLFDTACYHTAMPNVGGRDRRAVIMGWMSSASGAGGSAFTPEQAARLEASGRMTDTLRQLAGC